MLMIEEKDDAEWELIKAALAWYEVVSVRGFD
jgi:hypothetical protein